ncbi:unnamed protein product, partial [Staurois parvus]
MGTCCGCTDNQGTDNQCPDYQCSCLLSHLLDISTDHMVNGCYDW